MTTQGSFSRTRSLTLRLRLSTAILLFSATIPLGTANSARADDPPTRVGRIALIDGSAASFRETQDAQWTQAYNNYPIAQGASLWADQGTRVEVEIGEAVVWLAPGTELDITQLDDNNVTLSVPTGRVDLALHNKWPDEHYTLQTPSGQIDFPMDGSFRALNPDSNSTNLAAFVGDAHLASSYGDRTIHAGEEVQFSTDGNLQSDQAAPDDFDQWARGLDHQVFGRPVANYIPTVPGAADLAAYGAWQDVPDYGHVWIPSDVPSDWQPYRYGHWASVEPWGWTWVDDAPWGFAPFHYGRWVQVGSAWGWIPVEAGVAPTPYYHPCYSPAMVSFIGDPAALGIAAIGAGAIAWVALGPHEPWHPWYHTSDNYFQRVNEYAPHRQFYTNNQMTINQRVFVNQRFTTIVNRNEFEQGRPVNRVAMAVPAAVAQRPIPVVTRTSAVAALPPPRPAPPPSSPVPHPGPHPVIGGPVTHGPLPAPGVAPHPGMAPPQERVEHGPPGTPAAPARPGGPPEQRFTPPGPPAHDAEPGRPATPPEQQRFAPPGAPPHQAEPARPATPPEQHFAPPAPPVHEAEPGRPATPTEQRFTPPAPPVHEPAPAPHPAAAPPFQERIEHPPAPPVHEPAPARPEPPAEQRFTPPAAPVHEAPPARPAPPTFQERIEPPHPAPQPQPMRQMEPPRPAPQPMHEAPPPPRPAPPPPPPHPAPPPPPPPHPAPPPPQKGPPNRGEPDNRN